MIYGIKINKTMLNLIFTESTGILQHPLLGKNFTLKCKLVHAGHNVTNSRFENWPPGAKTPKMAATTEPKCDQIICIFAATKSVWLYKEHAILFNWHLRIIYLNSVFDANPPLRPVQGPGRLSNK